MRNWIRSFYQQLPVIRELKYLTQRVGQLEKRPEYTRPELDRTRLLYETSLMILALDAIKRSDPRYSDRQRLLAYGAQFWSQNFEDGMIAEIFRRIGVATKTFVEIGVGDGSENNTVALLSQGWHGWWLEGDQDNCQRIRAGLNKMPSLAARLVLRESFVSPEKIGALFKEMGIPDEVDLFSLDIDRDTYHIWDALNFFKPRVVVVEYNGGIPPHQSWILPYEPGQFWDGTQAFGASLKAFENLGRKFGYSLVGCDLTGINAFFVRNDLLGDHFAEPYTAENHYEPPRYHLLFRWGHRSSFFGESQDVK